MERWDRKSRLMEILTPVDSARAFEFENHTAVFDFTPIAHGVQGYYWDFPSVKQNVPTMNRGIFDARVYPHAPRADLKREFENALAQRAVELDDVHLMGHPERWYDPRAKHSAPRVLLAGDAAGTEPLLGEGISHAIHFGILAADAALDALRRENFSFANYERRIAWSRLGLHLRAKKIVAQVVFAAHGEWFYRWGFELLRILFANVNGESQSAT
ncbi:MAG: hypothetical protein HY070_09695 [Chloroflexi bacterium]|nr:hypothetical protein [Chloroflexota bacterium]